MFKKPDITAPRFKKTSKSVFSGELFKKFKQKYPQHNITLEQFKRVISSHSGKMWMEVVKSRDGIQLPEGIGTIFLGSTKILKKKNINIQASIAAGVPVLHRNWETDGYVAKIYFSSRLCRTNIAENGAHLWSFKGQRIFKRTVAREYPKNYQSYVTVLGRKKASQTYRKHSYKNYMEEKTEKAMKDYNEFDLA